MHIRLLASLALAATFPINLKAQQPCPADSAKVEGLITDPTGAVVSGARIEASDGRSASSDTNGRYSLSCMHPGTFQLRVLAEGFDETRFNVNLRPGQAGHADARLSIAAVQSEVDVSGEDAGSSADRTTGTRVLDAASVRQLADDPDEFNRQLQALAAAGGSIPGTALITVDGFQSASTLPPKTSIASIRINPDMFSSEYEQAPYLGGRIEIFTNPGADLLHGAVFFTDSGGSFNATDPLSLTATPASKRRYGFELSGPIRKQKTDFALALEKRDIDEFNVVNAITLDADQSQAAVRETVSAPQRLWIASARGDWQAAANDVATLSFTANVNTLGNQGVGGLVLPEAGYAGRVVENDLRFSNLQTFGASLLHQTRVGYSWKRTQQQANSTTPALLVPGFFTGGGSTRQAWNDRERDLEIDDSWSLSRGAHTVTLGAQSLGIFIHDYDPNTFNGQYIFGGGAAPGLDANGLPTSQTTTITGLEQLRRARLGLSGGTPTSFSITSGEPVVPFTQWRFALFANDTFKLLPRLALTAGLRYQAQTAPSSIGSISPRIGLSWSPDKKSVWVVHLRAGIFHDPNPQTYATEVYRLDGVRQRQVSVYSPNFQSPLGPSPGSTQVATRNGFPATLGQVSSLQTHASLDHTLPRGWHTGATFYWAENWNSIRTVNVNAPLIGSSIGAAPDPTAALQAPRPLALNLNIMQFQNSGHLSGGIVVAGAGKKDGKRFAFSATYVHQNLRSDADSDGRTSPQSSYSERGEAARISSDSRNGLYAYGTIHLPFEIDNTSILDALSGQAFNIITGTDSNGDGNFNDRPSFASALGAGVYSSRYGLLTTNTINGNIPRNAGTLPARVHLHTSLSRAFVLNPKNTDHLRTVAMTARSTNLINHTNVCAVGTVISSGNFAQPVNAETARRLELGIRFSF